MMVSSRENSLINKLAQNHSLSLAEYHDLVDCFSEENSLLLREKADSIRREKYGNKVFIRGLIEIGNVCHNDCYYCGIRRSNKECARYTLTPEQILNCCDIGYELGFRTFVMQGGEKNSASLESMYKLISEIKSRYSDCAVTLSLGEFPREVYKRLFEAGADRYLLRHETADKEHYMKLHPAEMSFENRIRCLYDLKDIGFQVGCGFMVGSPYQTSGTLAKDLKFIEEFKPAMCGIGPFIPQKSTPFKNEPAGTAEMTTYLLSIIRLIQPNILMPATTALGTIKSDGCKLGILSGANVVMPNLSPYSAREKYTLYDNKAFIGGESAEGLNELKKSMKSIGYEVVVSRGDAVL